MSVAELTALRNLGMKSAEQLVAVGIATPADLRRIGVEHAWELLRKQSPDKDICACALYALHGALSGEVWHKIPAAKKKHYKSLFNIFLIRIL